MSTPVIECLNIAKSYREGDSSVKVLQEINFRLEPGKSMAIIGVSGSGKSTLLNLLGGLDVPDRGEIRINGTVMARLPEQQRASWRNRHIGFVYQLHHLLMEFSALENVMMPLLIRGTDSEQASVQAKTMLEQVGLSHRLQHKPSALSGGERQRVAIARALVTQPSCVLMDEPTGNLDSRTAANVLSLINDLQTRLQLSFVVVTHDRQLANRIGAVYELDDGTLRAVRN